MNNIGSPISHNNLSPTASQKGFTVRRKQPSDSSIKDSFSKTDSNESVQSSISLDAGSVSKPENKTITGKIGETVEKLSYWTTTCTSLAMAGITNIPFPTIAKPFSSKEKEDIMRLIKPGDIVVQKDDRSAIMQTISHVTTGSDFIHAAIYKGDGKIIESVGVGVREANLDIYLGGMNSVEILRPPYKTKEDSDAAIKFAESKIGKPYNPMFEESKGKSYYCTQLVRDALESMPNPIKVTPAKPFGKNVVGTAQLKNIDGGEVVFSRGTKYGESMENIAKGTHSAAIFAAYFSIPATMTNIASNWVVQSII